jgi:hypothetical protein
MNFNNFSQIELGSASLKPYTFVSPKENTGTNDALNIEYVLYYKCITIEMLCDNKKHQFFTQLLLLPG